LDPQKKVVAMPIAIDNLRGGENYSCIFVLMLK